MRQLFVFHYYKKILEILLILSAFFSNTINIHSIFSDRIYGIYWIFSWQLLAGGDC